MEEHMTIAVDLAKTVFEIAGSRSPGRVCLRKRLSRTQFLPFIRNHPPATVLLEACGCSHHWGRQLESLGHRVLLLPPHHTRRYVLRQRQEPTLKALLDPTHPRPPQLNRPVGQRQLPRLPIPVAVAGSRVHGRSPL